jgi:hypothetical protein
MTYGNSDAGTTFTILADYHDSRLLLMQRDSAMKSAVSYG